MKKIKCALVTGAAGGLGLELARKMAPDCTSMVLIDVDSVLLHEAGEELRSRYGIHVSCKCVDLTDPEAVAGLLAHLDGEKIEIDVLVNNAGVGTFGDFSDTPWEKTGKLLQLNIISLTRLTRHFIPGMTRRNHGYILNVASMAAFQPGPQMAAYYASKAYILSFSRAVAFELRHSGVSVTALCPGPTRTGFQHQVGSEQSLLAQMNRLSSPEAIAAFGYRSMLKRKTVAIPGLLNLFIVLIEKFLPGKLLVQIVYRLQQLNRKPDHKKISCHTP